MSLKIQVKNILNAKQLSMQPVGGGDINDAFRIEADGHSYFLKYNQVSWAYQMFQSEKKGLELLNEAGVNVPEPLHVFKEDQGAGLILQWVDQGHREKDSWPQFGQNLAKLHRHQKVQFGLDHDNYIGRLDQNNSLMNDWLAFYRYCRIEPQVKMGINKGLLPPEALKLMDKSFAFIATIQPETSPSLLHGDLWSGNLMFDQMGTPVFIDPAVYFGHREMDIAMMKLFGGFEPGFSVYQAIYSLDKGWEERLPFYQLYYILVHVNLFGGSYSNSAMRILKRYAVL